MKEPDIALCKADLAVRIHRLVEHRRPTADEAAELLQVPKSELPSLFQGRLATCSFDQLVRMLTWLGDDIEILIRPRLHRTKRGAVRVLQAAAVEKPDDFAPVRQVHAKPRTRALAAPQTEQSGEKSPADGGATSETTDDRQLLDKHAVEKMTSLDITTIYRKMAAGTFPQPVKVGRRRVAWRTSDIVRWQQNLDIGTQTIRLRASSSGEKDSGPRGRRNRR